MCWAGVTSHCWWKILARWMSEDRPSVFIFSEILQNTSRLGLQWKHKEWRNLKSADALHTSVEKWQQDRAKTGQPHSLGSLGNKWIKEGLGPKQAKRGSLRSPGNKMNQSVFGADTGQPQSLWSPENEFKCCPGQDRLLNFPPHRTSQLWTVKSGAVLP